MNSLTTEQESRKQLYRIAYAFQIVGTVFSAFFFLIPLAWTIPMTLATKKAIEQVGTNEEIQHIALGVCSLFFSSLIGGILILVATNKSEINQPQQEYSQLT